MRMHRHHLLEIILWPNGDGTFRKIRNTHKRLIKLGIYYDFKLTITIPASEHIRMHANNRSVDTLRKMSAARKGKSPWNKSKKLSEEHRAKLSAVQKCKKLTAEHCAKISTANKGRKHSAETKAKMTAAKKGNTAVKGRRWYNNGITSIRAIKCPPGYTIGRIYKRKRVAK